MRQFPVNQEVTCIMSLSVLITIGVNYVFGDENYKL